jgi:hypothetical protein
MTLQLVTTQCLNISWTADPWRLLPSQLKHVCDGFSSKRIIMTWIQWRFTIPSQVVYLWRFSACLWPIETVMYQHDPCSAFSICFVLAWRTEFAAKYFAPILSHHSRARGRCVIPSSVSNFWTQIISAVAFASALYSASVLDLDMVGCFLAVEDTKLSPRNTAKPPVDLLWSIQPAQSALVKELTRA